MGESSASRGRAGAGRAGLGRAGRSRTSTSSSSPARAVQAEGGAPGADPEIVAYLAWSTVHGLAALWLGGPLQQAGRPFDELAGEVATLLGRAFTTPTGPTAPSGPTALSGPAVPSV